MPNKDKVIIDAEILDEYQETVLDIDFFFSPRKKSYVFEVLENDKTLTRLYLTRDQSQQFIKNMEVVLKDNESKEI